MCDGKYRVPAGFTIVSGGQTGADQAGLDWAIAHEIPHGGWCPKGRKSEDGPIDARYRLREATSDRYPERTRLNVRDSDATLIFTLDGKLEGGSAETRACAEQLGKPSRQVSPTTKPEHVAGFLERNRVKVLNIAGKRESSAPGVAAFVAEFLDRILELPSDQTTL